PKVAFELVDPATRLGRRRKRARSDWSPLMVGGRRLLLASDDDARVLRILETLDPDTLAAVLALHVTAGSEPGIAASLSVQPGEAARGLAAIRGLGERLTGQWQRDRSTGDRSPSSISGGPWCMKRRSTDRCVSSHRYAMCSTAECLVLKTPKFAEAI